MVHTHEGRATSRLVAGLVGLFIALLGGSGCDKGPDREQASKWYQRHKKTIEHVDEEIRKAIGEMNAFQGEFQCEPTQEEPPTNDGSEQAETLKKELKPAVDAMDCSQQEIEWQKRHSQKMAEFTREVLPTFLEHDGVLGVQISFFKPGDTTWYGLGNIGNYAGGLHDERLKGRDTKEIDGKRIGWGRFQTAYQRGGGKQYGDGTQHGGILVMWKFSSGNKTKFVVTMVVLGEHKTSKEWRAGWKERA
jgi:hypothetical protein